MSAPAKYTIVLQQKIDDAEAELAELRQLHIELRGEHAEEIDNLKETYDDELAAQLERKQDEIDGLNEALGELRSQWALVFDDIAAFNDLAVAR